MNEHKTKKNKSSFTARYNINKLVWYQEFTTVTKAIAREKQLKAGSRKKKIQLIEESNTEWKDLYEELIKIH